MTAAVVFVRDCGATTAYSTQVSIISGRAEFLERPTDSEATEAGNTLVIEGGDWVSPSIVETLWENNMRLVVTRPRGVKVFQEEATVTGITVVHREASPK
jgi:hypothetical protein